MNGTERRNILWLRARPALPAAAIAALALVVVPAADLGAQQASRPDVPALSAKAAQATKAGDVTKAVALYDQLIEATENDHVEALYAAAEFHALAGRWGLCPNCV